MENYNVTKWQDVSEDVLLEYANPKKFNIVGFVRVGSRNGLLCSDKNGKYIQVTKYGRSLGLNHSNIVGALKFKEYDGTFYKPKVNKKINRILATLKQKYK